MMMKVSVIAALVLSTCGWLFEPIPIGEHWNPPSHYRAIWDSAQACTGRRGDFDRITWYVVAGNSFSTKDGYAIGRWTRPHSISLSMDWATTDWVVKHEMIHDLLQRGHDEDDRHKIWGEQCRATWGYQPRDTLYRP